MSSYDITIFTKPISFKEHEKMLTPRTWEGIAIPNELLNPMLKLMMPSSVEEYDIAGEEVAECKRQWLSALAEEGYTAVRLSALNDGISAEATKEPLKW